jgi:hypothetical protein
VASTHVVLYLFVLLGISPFPHQDGKHTNGEWNDKRGGNRNKDVLNRSTVLFQYMVGK